MTTALEQQVDPLLDAIAILTRASIDALGGGLLEAVYKDPRSLATGTGFVGSLPAMSIYRGGQRRRLQSSAAVVWDVRVVFDYVLPQTRIGEKPDERELRWPALAKVWETLSETIIEGKHATVKGGADVLGAAGAYVEKQDSPDVKYGFADPNGDETYPFFRGVIEVVFCAEDVDASTLDDYLEHFTSFDKPGGDHTDPLATDTTILPAYGT